MQQTDRTIYVGSVGKEVDEAALLALFGHCGTVTQIRIAGDPSYDTRYAFIEFTTPEEAQVALLLDGMSVFDRSIKVSMARGGAGPGVVRSNDPDRVQRTVHVGGLPMEELSESVLAEFFQHVGEVLAVRKSGRFAWVEFSTIQAAHQALALDGEPLGTGMLKISQSKTPIHTAGWRAPAQGMAHHRPPQGYVAGGAMAPGLGMPAGLATQQMLARQHMGAGAYAAQAYPGLQQLQGMPGMGQMPYGHPGAMDPSSAVGGTLSMPGAAAAAAAAAAASGAMSGLAQEQQQYGSSGGASSTGGGVAAGSAGMVASGGGPTGEQRMSVHLQQQLAGQPGSALQLPPTSGPSGSYGSPARPGSSPGQQQGGTSYFS